MPTTFIADTSVSNVISYSYNNNLNNIKINSNVLINVLSYYVTMGET